MTKGQFDTYKAGGALAGTPKGEIMEEESRQKLADTAVAEKLKREIKGLERFNDSNLTSANFANRMVESRNILDSLLTQDPTAQEGATGFLGGLKNFLVAAPLGDMGNSLGDFAIKAGASPQQQQYLNAADNWISANLRKESGAVIGMDEMAKEYRKYFPTPMDSPEVIEQKKSLRKEAEKGMIVQSAGSYQTAFGKKDNNRQNPKPTPEQARQILMRRRGQ
jgi:hypothetical protein